MFSTFRPDLKICKIRIPFSWRLNPVSNFFYRPAALKGTLDDAVAKLTLAAEGDRFRITNNSPFHITVANISLGKTKLLRESPMVSRLGS